MKSCFYTGRAITWEQFLEITKKAFSTLKPEVITKLFVFDWETWLHPWMYKLCHHSKWRAFQFTHSPTNNSFVLMKWKESESSEEDFHGSEEHFDGVEILLEIPFGSPDRIHQTPLKQEDFAEISRCFADMTAEQQLYWKELIAEAKLPRTEIFPVPDNYFDFTRFSYAAWKQDHPDTYQQAAQQEPTRHSIEVDKTSSISATGDRMLDILVGDFVTIRNEETDSFWVGKVRCILDSLRHSDPPQPQYQIWFHVPAEEGSNIWDFKTKWRAEKIKDNPAALGIYTINHFLSVKFTMTKTKLLRKETIHLIRLILQVDAPNSPNYNSSDNENNNNNNNTSDNDNNINGNNSDNENNNNNNNNDNENNNDNNNSDNENNNNNNNSDHENYNNNNNSDNENNNNLANNVDDDDNDDDNINNNSNNSDNDGKFSNNTTTNDDSQIESTDNNNKNDNNNTNINVSDNINNNINIDNNINENINNNINNNVNTNINDSNNNNSINFHNPHHYLPCSLH
jgi:hypothetical protein